MGAAPLFDGLGDDLPAGAEALKSGDIGVGLSPVPTDELLAPPIPMPMLPAMPELEGARPGTVAKGKGPEPAWVELHGAERDAGASHLRRAARRAQVLRPSATDLQENGGGRERRERGDYLGDAHASAHLILLIVPILPIPEPRSLAQPRRDRSSLPSSTARMVRHWPKAATLAAVPGASLNGSRSALSALALLTGAGR
jgi:hypothetical protein